MTADRVATKSGSATTTGTCPVDGTETRLKFPVGKGSGKNTRQQHSRWHVCERGHNIYRKRGR
jgi:hypothetical protein